MTGAAMIRDISHGVGNASWKAAVPPSSPFSSSSAILISSSSRVSVKAHSASRRARAASFIGFGDCLLHEAVGAADAVPLPKFLIASAGFLHPKRAAKPGLYACYLA